MPTAESWLVPRSDGPTKPNASPVAMLGHEEDSWFLMALDPFFQSSV